MMYSKEYRWQNHTMTMPLANFPRIAPMTSWYCVTDRTPSSPIHCFCTICRDKPPMRALLLSSTIILQGARQGECLRLQQVACRCQTACIYPLAALPKRQNPLTTALKQCSATQDKSFAEHKDSTYATPHQMAAKPELEQSGAERQHRTRIERRAT